uniref:Uncharacterized protein n=1 Tax=Angiostrongylus cantonensis TaxID=6313 RepID=A0A0K0DF63_ANGCA
MGEGSVVAQPVIKTQANYTCTCNPSAGVKHAGFASLRRLPPAAAVVVAASPPPPPPDGEDPGAGALDGAHA